MRVDDFVHCYFFQPQDHNVGADGGEDEGMTVKSAAQKKKEKKEREKQKKLAEKSKLKVSYSTIFYCYFVGIFIECYVVVRMPVSSISCFKYTTSGCAE